MIVKNDRGSLLAKGGLNNHAEFAEGKSRNRAQLDLI